MLIKNKLIKIYKLLKLIGFDPISFFISIYRFPGYLTDYFKFIKNFNGKFFLILNYWILIRMELQLKMNTFCKI